VLSAGDCDENDPEVHPEATEICNEKDDNCNGETDEGTSPRSVYPDADGDGYGVASGASELACALPAGYADNADDCDDANIEAHPGALEVCNGLDDDCNQQTDENAKARCGVGWCERLAPSCAADSCVPGEPSPELCNGVDDDCDGDIDEAASCPEGSACRDAMCYPDDSTTDASPSGTPAQLPPSGTTPEEASDAPPNNENPEDTEPDSPPAGSVSHSLPGVGRPPNGDAIGTADGSSEQTSSPATATDTSDAPTRAPDASDSDSNGASCAFLAPQRSPRSALLGSAFLLAALLFTRRRQYSSTAT
jgi:hypothetical protein